MERREIKWYSETEIVNVETGEIITKSEYERQNLRIIQKTKNYEFKDEKSKRYGVIKIRWEVRENEQTRMFD